MRVRRVLERTAIRWAALAVAVAVALLALGGGLDAPAAGAKSPPGKVSDITITRGDGTVTASWDAVSGATSYHVTYSSDGAHSWTLAAYEHTSTSITISHAVNPNTYIVAVRARNGAGWGGWVNSAPSGPYSPGTSLPPSPPATPASVTVTRGEGVLYATWPAVSNATSYHVTYTYVFDRTGARKWWAAATHHASNSITIPHVWNEEQYVVAVRARNADGESGWVQSPLSPIYFSDIGIPDPPASVTVTRTNGSIAASWPAATHAQSYHVSYSTDNGAVYHLHAIDHTSTSITIDAHNSLDYVVAVASVNGNGVSERTYSASSPPFFAHRPSWVKVTRTDGALTATWPPASGATKYHVTYSSDGANSWTLGAYGATATSLDISGADNDASYIVAVRAGNDNGWSAWRNSPAAGPYTAPPATPTGLAVAPGNGFLGITWNAVASATGYDIRAKMSGASDWHDVASDVSATSYNYATTTTMDYVAVRARNSGGESGWAEVSRLPSAELLSTVSGESGGGGQVSGQAAGLVMAMALAGGEVSAQSNEVSGQSKLARPIWGTITRKVNRAFKADIDLNWTHTGWATGFNLVCSDTDGWTWNVCGWEDNSERVQYTSVPTAQSRPVTVTHYRRGTNRYNHTPGDYRLMSSRHYTVAIRAVNANPSQASDWVTTQIIRPIFPILSDFTWTRTDTQITMSWTPNPWTTGYKVYCDSYTPGGTYSPSYTLCATLTNQVDTATTHSVTITKSGGTHNWSSLDNTSTLDIKIVSTNATGEGEWLAPLMAVTKSLTVSNVGVATATLTVGSHTAQWWYKANTGPHTTCQGPVAANTATKDLTGLTGGTTYTYTAYSASGCASANEIATAAAFTTHGSVSTLGSTRSGDSNINSTFTKQATAFTTGSASTGGYVLKTVTIPLKNVSGSGGLTVTLHEWNGLGTYGSTSRPSDTVLATLSGTVPTSSSYTNTTWTCSGSGCELSPNTTYFIVANRTGSANYAWNYANSESETRSPSGNGWNIQFGHDYFSATWSHTGTYNVAEFVFAYKPSLAASNVTTTGATLTLANHAGAWYYKANLAPHATCQGPVSTSSVALSSLTTGSAYTYKAYSDSGCTTANLLATAAAFTPQHPPTLTASNVGATTARLTIANHTAQWWYKANVAPHTTCQGPVAANTASTNLTGLTANTTYTYKAYSASGCASANLLATAGTFTTSSLSSVSNLSQTTDGTGVSIWNSSQVATGFTTGASANGYSLDSVTIKFRFVPTGAQQNFTVAVHTVSGANPATTATYTLSGADPTSAGEYTYTCSGSCSLSANTTYFLVLTGDGTFANRYDWDTTVGTAQTNTPSGFGWSIADTARWKTGSWSDGTWTGILKLSATVNPILSASAITTTGATLTLANQNTSNPWYYKATTGPHTTCQGPVTGTITKALSGLNSGTSYTYSAYSASGCASANLIATAAAFTTSLNAPTGLNLSFNSGLLKMQATWSKPSGVTGAVSYELQHADSDRNNPYGSTTTIAATSASTVTHTFNNTLTIKFRVRAKVGSVTSAWAEYVSP